MKIKVLMVDDHALFRDGMRYVLQQLADEVEILDSGSFPDALQLARDNSDIDLALLDLNMPGSLGAQTIASWRREFPSVPLVILSATEDAALVRELIGLGVAAFIPKSDSASVMLQAVRLVLSGGTYAPLRFVSGASAAAAEHRPLPPANGSVPGLTPRQSEVLNLLARGLPNKTIARELGLSEATVKVHLLAVFRVLRARNRTEAVVAAQRWLGQKP